MSALNASPPKVYLIGAGPGHPCLLTKKAERCLQKADVILYDQFIPFYFICLHQRQNGFT